MQIVSFDRGTLRHIYCHWLQHRRWDATWGPIPPAETDPARLAVYREVDFDHLWAQAVDNGVSSARAQ